MKLLAVSILAATLPTVFATSLSTGRDFFPATCTASDLRKIQPAVEELNAMASLYNPTEVQVAVGHFIQEYHYADQSCRDEQECSGRRAQLRDYLQLKLDQPGTLDDMPTTSSYSPKYRRSIDFLDPFELADRRFEEPNPLSCPLGMLYMLPCLAANIGIGCFKCVTCQIE
ncbi:hypothetical protein BJ085DRAFT_33737 [Dimargaris cristalligena]|uniref:Uncharacterized protein n=1 Tax=Dimargaris cristalligena TaxID=215637 RepID=A0A4P9ZS98_9FUNG|nr:hypothetical protein BJ085DRAFT_33737 [Dimargaris cristalligena]|eukprot:RKP35340.1 hypothetical protein BJ085DRAFT_33737 [Dimargaris cristalligena]